VFDWSASGKGPFIAAFMTALLGACLFGVYVRRLRVEVSGGRPVTLLALREDLAPGTRIHNNHIAEHDVPETYVESRQIRASDAHKIIGIKTAVPLEANQTLAWTDLVVSSRDDRILSDHVPLGMRAISVPTSGSAWLGSLLSPGDRVDVLVTRESADGRSVTAPVLQNVLVLSVGDRTSALDRDRAASGRAITLLVTVDQAALLVHAKRDSLISVILRNPDDLEVNDGLPETRDADIFDVEKRIRRSRRATLERVE
jgi:pilus assembly protein CpaB